jgi:hypothetical protein
MSLTGADLVRLPYDDSLTQAGVTFTCRSLQYPRSRTHRPSPRSMLNQVAEIAVTLALQRWLEAQDVPFDLIQATPFTFPDRRTLLLGGRRVKILPALVSASRRIQSIQAEPSLLLNAEASVHDELLIEPRLRGQDLLIFMFLLGQETRTIASLRRADATAKPTHIIAIPPPKPWRDIAGQPKLEGLSVQNEGDHTVELTFFGQLENRHSHVLPLKVPANRHITIPAEFTAIYYIYSAHLPVSRIRIVGNRAVHAWIIPVRDWINIWTYGREIILTGWSTLAAFQRETKPSPDGEREPIRPQIRKKGLRFNIRQLRPMRELIERTLQG